MYQVSFQAHWEHYNQTEPTQVVSAQNIIVGSNRREIADKILEISRSMGLDKTNQYKPLAASLGRWIDGHGKHYESIHFFTDVLNLISVCEYDGVIVLD